MLLVVVIVLVKGVVVVILVGCVVVVVLVRYVVVSSRYDFCLSFWCEFYLCEGNSDEQNIFD